MKSRRRDALLSCLLAVRQQEPSMTMTSLIAFLYIAENPGINIVELAEVANLNMPTASRVARSLAEKSAVGALPPYYGFVEVFAQPDNPRGRMLDLTKRGVELCQSFDGMIKSAVTIR